MAPLGKDITYMLSRWKKLTEYIKHPFLEIDNNWVENTIRPTVIGRKNYMFAGSHDGASRSAMIYSFFWLLQNEQHQSAGVACRCTFEN